MNKPTETKILMPVKEFAKTRLSRRGNPVSVQYIYRLIQEAKEGKRELDFKYLEMGPKKAIWIVK